MLFWIKNLIIQKVKYFADDHFEGRSAKNMALKDAKEAARKSFIKTLVI